MAERETDAQLERYREEVAEALERYRLGRVQAVITHAILARTSSPTTVALQARLARRTPQRRSGEREAAGVQLILQPPPHVGIQEADSQRRRRGQFGETSNGLERERHPAARERGGDEHDIEHVQAVGIDDDENRRFDEGIGLMVDEEGGEDQDDHDDEGYSSGFDGKENDTKKSSKLTKTHASLTTKPSATGTNGISKFTELDGIAPSNLANGTQVTTYEDVRSHFMMTEPYRPHTHTVSEARTAEPGSPSFANAVDLGGFGRGGPPLSAAGGGGSI